ncbi:hypothetical protein [Clostridium sp. BJN0013]|uniref:hypothetical protein n=1 Tax=Clostridium sp. BJN0013 TaxID=3236840 RepID=UPI0034C68D28
MEEKKQRELEELSDEVDIILSYKDTISTEEINNFVNKFSLLSEYEIREKIKELTGDSLYIQESDDKAIEEKQYEDIKKIEIMESTEEDLKPHNNASQDSEAKSMSENEPFYNTPEEVFDINNIPEVSFVKAEVKYGQLSLEWGWPRGINKVMLCYRMDRFPSGYKDSSAHQILIEKKDPSSAGDYIMDRVVEGNYYFSIYTLVECGGKMIFSQGQRRLVINKIPQEIFYEIKIRRNILGKLKSAELILSTDKKEINVPPLVLIGRVGNMPLQKSQGETLVTTDYQTFTKNERLSFPISTDSIGRNMYAKLFFVEDINSKMYRIISPAKNKLYFK